MRAPCDIAHLLALKQSSTTHLTCGYTAATVHLMSRADEMMAFIVANLNAGRTCYLATMTKVTMLKKKHLVQVRVRGNALEIQCGKRWLDYTHTGLSAQ